MVMDHYDEFVLCCLPGAFPHVFFLGKGVPTSGSVVGFQWPSTMVVGGADYGNPASLGLAMDLKMTEKAVLSQVRVLDSIIKL